MRFEHLVQINDPLDPLIDPLTREQLWRGLLRYIETPVAFVQSLDRGTVVSREGNTLKRELQFGRHVVHDEVVLQPSQSIHITTRATAEIPAGSLSLHLEEPSQELLFVRFIYETFPQGHAVAPPEYQAVMKNAYKAASIDVISVIRQMAEAGSLDAPVH
jgi:hypothetical protein